MKRWFAGILSVVVFFSLCACGDVNTETTENTEVAESVLEEEQSEETQEVEAQEEISETEEQNENNADEEESEEEIQEPEEIAEEETDEESIASTDEVNDEETAAEDSAIAIGMSDVIETDCLKMSFESVEIVAEFSGQVTDTTKVVVSDPGEGYQFIILKGHVENTGSATIDAYRIDISLLANDQYAYDDFSLVFMKSSPFELEALADADFYIYGAVPDKLVEIIETATYTIMFNEDMSYITTITSSDGKKTVEADYSYKLSCALGNGAEAATGETTNNAQEDATVSIHAGDTIVTDSYEFTLNKVELIEELKPSNTSSVYRTYTAESGKIYIHVDGSYYNVSKADVCIRDLPVATADYNDGYGYTGFVVVDDGDNDFDWSSSTVVCTPLETCHYHCLIECPVEIETSDASLYVLLTLADGITYRYDIR